MSFYFQAYARLLQPLRNAVSLLTRALPARWLLAKPFTLCLLASSLTIMSTTEAIGAKRWALNETFDGNPAGPSQALLPGNFDYVVTHRTEAKEQFTKQYMPYPADHHADHCGGPDPSDTPVHQHTVYTSQTSNGARPDQSFFICKNHMMSSMGEVGPYSLSAFWPRQEFDFSDGGTLMFDVGVAEGHSQRHWWEVMIVPRDQLKVGAGPDDSAIDERYPEERIVLSFKELIRGISVGTGAPGNAGEIVGQRQWLQYDFARWNDLHSEDPALDDRRIRRTMRVKLQDSSVTWGIRTNDGVWDNYKVNVPGGLPFTRGLVVFKTHAYTPYKQNNFDTYTFHWDNIKFDGPVVGKYDAHHASDVVYLQRDGHRQIGDAQTVSIELPRTDGNPVLFGQLHSPKRGQVLLSINGRPRVPVNPYQYDSDDDCYSSDWKSFRLPLQPEWLIPGNNTFEWSVGPRPACDYGPYDWDGFSVKFLQVQTDQ